MLMRYFNILRELYIKENDIDISYKSWVEKWNEDFKQFYDVLEDSFRSELGCRILEVFINCDMLKKVLIKSSKDKSQYVLEVIKDKHFTQEKSLVSIPTKLPMVVKPKPYSNNISGGYFLNNYKYHEDLFIEKRGYGIKSKLSENTKIYDMINKINGTPFMVNHSVLNFLLEKGYKLNLLIDTSDKHKFSDIEKKTKYQESVPKSYNSKVILQENILAISLFFSKFSQIYFPVRLDQRGRLYCSPNFFNYQSNELSKALLLFANPGIIRKDDLQSIIYLKAYGANCFSDKVSKNSTSAKLNWVDENLDNIMSYENNILLSKAKDKLLFLAFSIEFKRFYNFYINPDLLEFKTYLPIQLDATCNGFQHMALLSNEKELFEQLNLTSTSQDNPPKDFYNFLLHKLRVMFKSKLDKGESIDIKTNGSYERLQNFLWTRSPIKKAIITIPYNSTSNSMKNYIIEYLERVGWDEESKCLWFQDKGTNISNKVSSNDIHLLINSISTIIENDFRMIRKLIHYLSYEATVCNKLHIPITWSLPTGLKVYQSYLKKIGR